MILVKKTAVLSPRGAHGVSGVARFECFKEKSDVKISLARGHKDLYAVVAVGEEKRVVKLSGARIYLARTDLSGPCAAIVADGEKRVLCAGATVSGYDFTPLEEFLPSAFGDKTETDKSVNITENKTNDREISDKDVSASESNAEKIEAVKAEEKPENNEISDIAAYADDGKEIETKAVKEEKVTVDSKKTPETEIEDVKSVVEENHESADKEVRFFDKIADKIEKLFAENNKDEELTVLIPDSRWVRVKADDGWYVVGIVGEPAEFICYGIPDDDATNPPDEEEGCRQWLEIERGGRGYWMMYQSAESGETLTAI